MRVFLTGTPEAMDFAEVLESASRSAGIDLDAGPAMRRPRFRDAPPSLDALAESIQAARASVTSAPVDPYLEHQREKAVQRAPLDTDPQAIATELSISERMSIADLNRLRRDFALANHPDRFSGDERHDATRRMMIANMLIDSAVKQRHAQ